MFLGFFVRLNGLYFLWLGVGRFLVRVVEFDGIRGLRAVWGVVTGFLCLFSFVFFFTGFSRFLVWYRGYRIRKFTVFGLREEC